MANRSRGRFVDRLRALPLRMLKRWRHQFRKDLPRHPTHDGYKERLAQLRLFRDRPVQVIFLGDSNVENGEFQERFETLRVGNRGVRGDTTAGILERLDDVVAEKAPYVFIMAGINDLGMGLDQTWVLGNLTKISTRLADSGSQVYLQSILYSDNLTIDHRDIDHINAELNSLAERDDRIRYVDVNRIMSSNGSINSDYSFDGTHLSAEGYRVWWNFLEPILKEVFSPE